MEINSITFYEEPRFCTYCGTKYQIVNYDIIQEGKMTLEDIQTHNDLINELNTEALKGTPLSAREVIWLFIVYAEKYLSTKEE